MDRAAIDSAVAPTGRRRAPLSDDVRWMLLTGVVFVASLALLAAAYWAYRATGPHPQVMFALRRMRYYSRWLTPGL